MSCTQLTGMGSCSVLQPPAPMVWETNLMTFFELTDYGAGRTTTPLWVGLAMAVHVDTLC